MCHRSDCYESGTDTHTHTHVCTHTHLHASRVLHITYTHFARATQEIEERSKRLVRSIQNDLNSSYRTNVMNQIKRELNEKRSGSKPKLSNDMPSEWLITDEHSPEERARRQKENIEIRKQNEEWKELAKLHREDWNDSEDQYEQCNLDQREGMSLEEIANSGNPFAKRLMSLTMDDPFVQSLGLFKKFSVNSSPEDGMFASLTRSEGAIANDFIGFDIEQFVFEVPCDSLVCNGVNDQAALDHAVQDHLDRGSVPPSKVGVVMKTFAASICSRLEKGDLRGADGMLMPAHQAWKLLKPYYSKYHFRHGRVDVIPPKNPLLDLMSLVDPQWRNVEGSESVEEFYNMMNGKF